MRAPAYTAWALAVAAMLLSPIMVIFSIPLAIGVGVGTGASGMDLFTHATTVSGAFHGLRHTAGKTLADLGADPRMIHAARPSLAVDDDPLQPGSRSPASRSRSGSCAGAAARGMPREQKIAKPVGSFAKPPPPGWLTIPKNRATLRRGRVPLPVGRAGFKPVGGRAGVFGRFDSCLFRLKPTFAALRRP